MIAEMFRPEDQSKPLSDREIVKMLGEKGIVIAPHRREIPRGTEHSPVEFAEGLLSE